VLWEYTATHVIGTWRDEFDDLFFSLALQNCRQSLAPTRGCFDAGAVRVELGASTTAADASLSQQLAFELGGGTP
jgi:hypothetical protein